MKKLFSLVAILALLSLQAAFAETAAAETPGVPGKAEKLTDDDREKLEYIQGKLEKDPDLVRRIFYELADSERKYDGYTMSELLKHQRVLNELITNRELFDRIYSMIIEEEEQNKGGFVIVPVPGEDPLGGIPLLARSFAASGVEFSASSFSGLDSIQADNLGEYLSGCFGTTQSLVMFGSKNIENHIRAGLTFDSVMKGFIQYVGVFRCGEYFYLDAAGGFYVESGADGFSSTNLAVEHYGMFFDALVRIKTIWMDKIPRKDFLTAYLGVDNVGKDIGLPVADELTWTLGVSVEGPSFSASAILAPVISCTLKLNRFMGNPWSLWSPRIGFLFLNKERSGLAFLTGFDSKITPPGTQEWAFVIQVGGDF